MKVKYYKPTYEWKITVYADRQEGYVYERKQLIAHVTTYASLNQTVAHNVQQLLRMVYAPSQITAIASGI